MPLKIGVNRRARVCVFVICSPQPPIERAHSGCRVRNLVGFSGNAVAGTKEGDTDPAARWTDGPLPFLCRRESSADTEESRRFPPRSTTRVVGVVRRVCSFAPAALRQNFHHRTYFRPYPHAGLPADRLRSGPWKIPRPCARSKPAASRHVPRVLHRENQGKGAATP